ncbi:MAG TPA: hypothetical protein VN739_04815, partial [Nitrososphaerales archaeon]|nr:hypothetical protein [Nitrososphaerales archaeon]
MAEYRRQIAVGGIAAVLLAISIALAVIYVPTLNLQSATISASISSTTNSTSSSSAVTIHVNRTTTSNNGPTSSSEQTRSSKTQTVTVTVTRNGTVTTVYRNGTTTVYQNNTETTTVTVTSIFIGSSTVSNACPPYGGSGTPLYCIPMMISNTQLSPIASGTQIMLRVDWASFSSYLAPNVGNVVFADASGNPVYAWCESSCTNTQPISNFWIKDDAAIPPAGQQGIFMYIFPISQIQYSSTGYWGAFPIITATYGQYDNGPKVFDFYNNFNGTALCSCLTAVPFLGGLYSGGSANYSVSNGLTITAIGAPSGAGFGYHIYLNTPESFTAIDSNVVATDLPTSVG